MRSLFGVLAFLAFLLSMMPPAFAQIVVLHPLVRPLPVEEGQIGAPRTANSGEYVLRQTFVHDRFARLLSPVGVTDGSKVFLVTPDNRLFGASVGQTSSTGFCTFENAYHGRNAIGVEGRFPVCLVDRDNDGKFDRIYAAPFGGAFGVRIGDWGHDISPAAYTVVAENPPRRVEIGLQFVRTLLQGGQLHLVELHGNADAELLKDGVTFIPRQLPALVTIHGAQIEITSLESVLAFRVISGFATAPAEMSLDDPPH